MNFLKSIPVHMDFEGQQKAEKLFQCITVAFAVVGFGWGFQAERFSYAVYTLVGGFLFSCLLVLPPWPCYRRHPLRWQKVKPAKSAPTGAAIGSDGDEPADAPATRAAGGRRKK